jgi:UDP-N-acetylglucosamine 4,6-dehydratase/5-epimerase
MKTEFLEGRTVLITGGTGSFGKTILERLVKSHVRQIRVFSRDEAKQDQLRDHYSDQRGRVDFVTGDVRDLSSLRNAMEGADYVFHAAALKQVPNCERFPMEAVRTNVLGAANLLQAVNDCMPLGVVAISTDKAVEPLNVMGLTKALMERIVLSRTSRRHSKVVAVRYGNVVGSRGSVIPLFLGHIAAGRSLPVTHPDMTRFLFCLQDSVDLVLKAVNSGRDGELWVKKMPSSTVMTIAEACLKLKGAHLPIETVGVRPGEKMHEILVSVDEMSRAREDVEHFVISPDRQEHSSKEPHEYSSANTERLGVDQVVELMLKAGLT